MISRVFASRRALGLETHALLVSASLILLVALLGFRAYSMARAHFAETRALIDRDTRASSLLQKMEKVASSRDHAVRKLEVTGDPAYARTIEKMDDTLKTGAGELSAALDPVDRELGLRARTLRDPSQIADMKDKLANHREERLRSTSLVTQDLLRLIMVALGLSIAITGWMLFLFYRGLIRPLGRLKTATMRIQEGDFSYRVRSRQGVAELCDLSESFNSMAERLESLDQAKTEFLAMLSHEIKNPLAALKEGLNLLASQGDRLSPESRAKGFNACLISSKRVEGMINNLLSVASGKMDLFAADMAIRDLPSAIQSAIDAIRPIAEKRGMSVRFQQDAMAAIAFSWNGIIHVCENLLQNAIKYGQEGSVIEVRAALRDASAVVEVENAGRGIAQSDLSRIFDIFYRGTNTSRQQGMGIGLHVVRKIIQAHRGSIEVRSEGGRTSFRFWIPVMGKAGAPA